MQDQKYDLNKTYLAPIQDKEKIGISTDNIQVYYGDNHAFYNGSLKFPQNKITALIGASGSGKSTFLRCLNRMNDNRARVDGKIMYRDLDINSPKINVHELRTHIGMVFQQPNPFAKSIKKNITFSLKQHGIKDAKSLNERVEKSLRAAALWDEVKDNLDDSALSLSGGQQQRLCIARAIAMKPDILLLDEPASALDPISAAEVESTLAELKKDYTIIIVTHNMQQASRISDYTSFFHLGHILEFDKTKRIFTRPHLKATQDYISGNFG